MKTSTIGIIATVIGVGLYETGQAIASLVVLLSGIVIMIYGIFRPPSPKLPETTASEGAEANQPNPNQQNQPE